MDENNENKNETNVNAKEIKTEIKETTKEVKESIKNTNLKNDAKEAKYFAKNFFKTPLTELKKVVTNPKSFLKIAIIVFAVWLVAECVYSIIDVVTKINNSPYYYFSTYARNSFSDIMTVIKATLAPAISVALLSGIIYFMVKGKNKNYLTIVTTVVTAKIPVIIASIVSLLGLISTDVAKITNSFSSFCSIISTVFIYFALKALHSDNDDTVAKTFIITMAIYYGIALVLKFFTLYI